MTCAGRSHFIGDRKRQWQQFSFKTQTLPSVCTSFSNMSCVILNTSHILHSIHMDISEYPPCIKIAALAQYHSHPGHSCKKYDFLPVGNFLFMSECRSGEGDSGLYLIYHHPSLGVTPVLMMQYALEPSVITLNKIPFAFSTPSYSVAQTLCNTSFPS